jgi:type II secretory ATPase GspE/PulE/Tfp pilus assembly ATPase PilB-like protein
MLGNTATVVDPHQTISAKPSGAVDVGQAVPSLIEPLSLTAEAANGFADQLFATSRDRGSDTFAEMDSAAAKTYVEQLVIQRGINTAVGNLADSFSTTDILLEHLDTKPFGCAQVVDAMTGKEHSIPVLETLEAETLRDIMSRAGLVPLYAVQQQVVFAVRVDENTATTLPSAMNKEARQAVAELNRINPELALDPSPGGVIPVSGTTYDLITSAVVDPKYRATKAVTSCDHHFDREAATAEYIINAPKLIPLQQLFPGDSATGIVQAMHYQPFIEAGQTKLTDGDATSKQGLPGVAKGDVHSVFDLPEASGVKAASVRFLKERCSSQGFIPLRIEANDANEPVVVLGFRAYEADPDGKITLSSSGSGYAKRSWEDIVSSAQTFLETLKHTFPNHIPQNTPLERLHLTPIPNHYFGHLLEQIGDPQRRKSTLNIIDRPSGIFNYQQLLEYAVKIGAQEVYFQMDSTGPKVRFDVAGNVFEAPFKYSVGAFVKTLQSLVAVMSNQHANLNIPVEGSIRFSGCTPADFARWEQCHRDGSQLPVVPGKDVQLSIYPRGLEGIALRLEYTPLITGPQIVARIHRLQQKPPELHKLGLRPEVIEAIEKIVQRTSGAIFVVAPTGAGKTTLLASLLQAKNTEGRVITTMEHPVEFILPGIAQVELNEARGLTGIIALKAALRSAPHIIMVGEARVKEEAMTALEGAATGHLMFSTLHTSDAPEAFLRLKLMGIDPFFIANQVSVVIAQRLVRQFTPVKHSLEYKPQRSLLEQYDCRSELEGLMMRPGAFDKPIMVYRPRAEKENSNAAYQGRIPVNEIVVKTPALQEMLLRPHWAMNDLTSQLTSQKDVEVPFEPMIVCGMKWVLEGRTSIAALYRGDKGIPREQFITYAPQIIAAVKSWQEQG